MGRRINAFMGRPGSLLLLQAQQLPGLFKIGVSLGHRPQEDSVKALREQTGHAWELEWWKWADDCGRVRQQVLEALAPRQQQVDDLVLFAVPQEALRRLIKAACAGEPLDDLVSRAEGRGGLRFVVFRAQADGNWYWALFDGGQWPLGRGGPWASLQDCMQVVQRIQQGAAAAHVQEHV